MKKLFTILLSIALFVGSSAFAATTYYVQASAAGTNTWDAGYASSGTIVDLSTVNGGGTASFNAWFTDKSLATPAFSGTKFTSGDQVWIAKGTYFLTGTVALYAGVSVYGGFAGTAGETVLTRAKNTTDKWDFTNPTVFDGSVSGTKTYIAFTGGSATTTIIDGLTIQNCTNGATNSSGGAAKLTSTGTTMQNCIITGCTATTAVTTGASAGVTLQTGASLKDSYLHHNTATSTGTCGGAITVYGNACSVSGCKIEYNTNTQGGGGLFLYSTTSGASISNCSFSNNSATLTGGAISSYVANANTNPISISNCTFNANYASSNGGAMNLSSTITTNIYNVSGCTFTSNYSAVASGNSANGGGAVILNTCAFTLDKCSFTGNYTTLATGGALQITSASSCLISNSRFIANTAGSATTSSGAAIYSKTSYTANNCLFADNTGTTPIHFYAATAVSTFQNCTFANNLTSVGAAAPVQLLNIGTAPYPPYIFSNCLFYNVSGFSGQTAPTTTTCASDRTLSSISIKTISTSDFVDAANVTVASRNYQLSPTSLALNAGTDLTQATSPVTKDISDVSRPQGGTFDIGAYELPFFTTSISYNSEGGSVSPATVSAAAQGSTQPFVITPVYGYQLSAVTYNGVDVKSQLTNLIDGQNTYNGGTYTVSSLAGNYTLAVTFSQVITTGITESKKQLSFRVNHGILQIDGVQSGTEINIYSVSGSKIKSERAGNSISLPQGVYVVKVAGEVRKIVLN